MEALRRRAWWYLLALSVLIALFGVGDVLGGVTVDPGITLSLTGLTPAELGMQSAEGYRAFDFTTRTQGASLIVMGVVLTAILLVPYREGRRWAWNLMWVLPAWTLAGFSPTWYLALLRAATAAADGFWTGPRGHRRHCPAQRQATLRRIEGVRREGWPVPRSASPVVTRSGAAEIHDRSQRVRQDARRHPPGRPRDPGRWLTRTPRASRRGAQAHRRSARDRSGLLARRRCSRSRATRPPG